jgi:hypothetical protein
MGTPQSDVAITKTQRWLDLIAFPVGHRFPVAGEAIMGAVPAIRCLKPDAESPEDREVDPCAVGYAEGRCYVIGNCPERPGIRAFRTNFIRLVRLALARLA